MIPKAPKSKKNYLIALLLLSFTGCSREIEEPPEWVLSMDRMAAVMTEIQVLEGGILVRKIHKTDRNDEVAAHYKAIFNRYGVTLEAFEKSLAYYTDHPELLESVYEDVITQVSTKQAEAEHEK